MVFCVVSCVVFLSIKIDGKMTINRCLSMVVACIARNRTCLNGLAKPVDDANLRFKKIK